MKDETRRIEFEVVLPNGRSVHVDVEPTRDAGEIASVIANKARLKIPMGHRVELYPEGTDEALKNTASDIGSMFAAGIKVWLRIVPTKVGVVSIQKTSRPEDTSISSRLHSTSATYDEYTAQHQDRQSPKRWLASAWNWLNKDRPQLGFWFGWFFSFYVTLFALFFLVPEIPHVLRWRPLWRGLVVVLMFTILILPCAFMFIMGVVVMFRWLRQRFDRQT
jgi:hypothetical protein